MKQFYKHATFGHVYGDSVKSPLGRFAWPFLVTPRPPGEKFKEAQPRYECTVVLPKDAEGVEEFLAEIESQVYGMDTDEGFRYGMLDRFNGDDRDDGKKSKGSKLTLGDDLITDGDNADIFDPEKYPYYLGCWVLCARNAKQPEIFGPKGKLQPLDPKDIVGGLLGKLIITPIMTAKGLSFKLERLQMLKDDGVRIGGGVRDFDAMLESCEDGDDDDNTTGTTGNSTDASEGSHGDGDGNDSEESQEGDSDETESTEAPTPAPARRGRPPRQATQVATLPVTATKTRAALPKGAPSNSSGTVATTNGQSKALDIKAKRQAILDAAKAKAQGNVVVPQTHGAVGGKGKAMLDKL